MNMKLPKLANLLTSLMFRYIGNAPESWRNYIIIALKIHLTKNIKTQNYVKQSVSFQQPKHHCLQTSTWLKSKSNSQWWGNHVPILVHIFVTNSTRGKQYRVRVSYSNTWQPLKHTANITYIETIYFGIFHIVH